MLKLRSFFKKKKIVSNEFEKKKNEFVFFLNLVFC